MSDEGGTFTHADVQAWIDSLGPRETAMLAHVVGRYEAKGAAQALSGAVEWCADHARRHANKSRMTSAKAVREVIGVLLRVQRDAIAAFEKRTPETVQ